MLKEKIEINLIFQYLKFINELVTIVAKKDCIISHFQRGADVQIMEASTGLRVDTFEA